MGYFKVYFLSQERGGNPAHPARTVFPAFRAKTVDRASKGRKEILAGRGRRDPRARPALFSAPTPSAAGWTIPSQLTCRKGSPARPALRASRARKARRGWRGDRVTWDRRAHGAVPGGQGCRDQSDQGGRGESQDHQESRRLFRFEAFFVSSIYVDFRLVKIGVFMFRIRVGSIHPS